MALDNYANLKASIESWSHRDDVKDIIDDFILIAEAEMYANDDASLRLRSMEALDTSAANTSDRFLALPSDYLETRSLDLTVSDYRLPIEYKTPNDMFIDTNGARVPTYYTVTSQIEFDSQPDEAYVTNLLYYKKLTALSSSNTTNAILDDYPQVYLNGALWQLNVWAENDINANKYYTLFVKSINGANKTDQKGRYGVAPRQRIVGNIT